MTEEKEPNNIHEAIIAVMNEVGYVQKSKAQGLNYTFAGEAALIQALRPAMIENQIVFQVSNLVKTERESYTSKHGTNMTSTVLVGKIKFTHAPSSTFIEVMAIGEGADAGDKSAPKAMTGLLKYGLRQTFLIETGDDPDTTPSEELEKEERPIFKWPPYMRSTLVETGVVKNENHADKLLDLFPNLPKNTSKERLVSLATIYRARRALGKDDELQPKEAADVAWNEWSE